MRCGRFKYGANALLLVWAIALVRRLVRQQDAAIPGDRRAQWAFWLLTVVLSVRHVAAVFSNQSNDLPGFVLVLLGMTGMASRRDFAGGLAIGLAAASKATPILFLPFLLLLRRFRASAGTMVGTLLGSLAPDVLFPRTDHRYWVESWFSTFVAGINPADGGNTAAVGNAWKAWNILNQNLASMFYRLFTEVEPIADHTFDISLWHMDRGALGLLTLTAQLVVATVLIYAAWRARHLDAPRQALGIGSLLVCGMVLLSPMSSKSHFCVLVAPIALCVHDFVFRRRDRLVLVCLMVLFVGALTSKGCSAGAGATNCWPTAPSLGAHWQRSSAPPESWCGTPHALHSAARPARESRRAGTTRDRGSSTPNRPGQGLSSHHAIPDPHSSRIGRGHSVLRRPGTEARGTGGEGPSVDRPARLSHRPDRPELGAPRSTEMRRGTALARPRAHSARRTRRGVAGPGCGARAGQQQQLGLLRPRHGQAQPRRHGRGDRRLHRVPAPRPEQLQGGRMARVLESDPGRPHRGVGRLHPRSRTRPRQPWVYFARAKSLLVLGEMPHAKRDLQQALRLDPKDPHTHAQLGFLEATLGDEKTALAHFDRAVALDQKGQGMRPPVALLAPRQDGQTRRIGIPRPPRARLGRRRRTCARRWVDPAQLLQRVPTYGVEGAEYRQRRCEAHFYLGLRSLLTAHPHEAHDFLVKALVRGDRTMPEWRAALRLTRK
ncbi:MAG: DUF2029 domain-containing protein [Planctomycetes bacterium]|nr:DUF2029 domain-containing protein [Planctomycetota bacterium]